MDASTRKALTAVTEILAGLLTGDSTEATPVVTPARKKGGSTKKGAKKAAARENGFVEWLHATAEDRHARQNKNREQAAWMRSVGVVPSGKAWKAVAEGERGVKALKALNAADGLTFVERKTTTAKATAKVTTDAPAKSARKSSVAASRPRRADGTFLPKQTAAQVTAAAKPASRTKKERQALAQALQLRNTLAALGVDEDAIVRALEAKGLPTEVPVERV